MGLFSKIFCNKKHNAEQKVFSFAEGKLVNITEIPDPVFSQKIIGDGFAILPTKGELYAPISGEIIQVFPTKHAIGIKSEDGLELLIHIGLNTVKMKGEGFEDHVHVGDYVSAGDKLVTFDFNLVKERASSLIISCVITNMNIVEKIEFLGKSEVKIKEEVAVVKIK